MFVAGDTQVQWDARFGYTSDSKPLRETPWKVCF